MQKERVLFALSQVPHMPERGVAPRALPELTTAALDEHVGGVRHAFLLFTAPWCDHCKTHAPAFHGALQQLVAERWRTVSAWSVNADAHPTLVRRFSIDGAPTLLLVPANRSASRDNALVYEQPTISRTRVMSWGVSELDKLTAGSQVSRAVDGPPSTFEECLLRADERSFSHAYHLNRRPLFSLCRDLECAFHTHKRTAGLRLVPRLDFDEQDNATRHALGRLPGAPAPRLLPEFVCTEDSDAPAAVAAVEAALRQQKALVLRGCATGMPAVKRWAKGARGEAIVNDPKGENTDRLAAAFLPDTRWPSAFSDLLQSFTPEPHVWASRGNKNAALHYDDVDNIHLVVAGQKDFSLVDPGDLPNLYVDFPPPPLGSEPLPDNIVCPGDTSVGCDAFSCYGYVPFDAELVDLTRFPRVADALVHTHSPSLRAGDAVVMPAFWSHRVIHHVAPRRGGATGGGGRNIALSFTKPGPGGLTLRPYADDIAQMWRDAQPSSPAAAVGPAVAAPTARTAGGFMRGVSLEVSLDGTHVEL